MKQKTKNIIVLAGMLLFVFGIYLWFFVFNKGSIEIQTGLKDYQVQIDQKTILCAADPCTFSLRTGFYPVTITKKDRASLNQTVFIKRGEVVTLKADLKRAYSVEMADAPSPPPSIPSKDFPKDWQKKIVAGVWNQDGSRLIFLDAEDQRVKVLNADLSVQPITVLKGIKPPLDFQWSPSENALLGYQENSLYWIDTLQAARRKQVLDFVPLAPQWLPNGHLVLFNDSDGMLYRWQGAGAPQATLVARLDQSVFIDDKTMLYFEWDAEAGHTSFKTYEPGTGLQFTLAFVPEWEATQILFDSEKKTAYFQGADQSWRQLKLEAQSD